MQNWHNDLTFSDRLDAIQEMHVIKSLRRFGSPVLTNINPTEKHVTKRAMSGSARQKLWLGPKQRKLIYTTMQSRVYVISK